MKSQRTTLPVFKISISPEPLSIAPPNKKFYPVTQSQSVEGTIGAFITSPVYSEEQQQTWRTIFEKHDQLAHSTEYLCPQYREGLEKLKFAKLYISSLNIVSNRLKELTGWEIIRVEGYVTPKIFLQLLANKLFPCTDFIRSKDEIDFTAQPDTFHDQVGHLPMMANQQFADFVQLFGIASTKVNSEEQFEWFNRIYWFTVETGLINPTVDKNFYDPNCTRIYGASIASSCGEILYSLSDKAQRYKFDIDRIINTPFDITEKQSLLFEISSFDELEHSFRTWAIRNNFIN